MKPRNAPPSATRLSAYVIGGDGQRELLDGLMAAMGFRRVTKPEPNNITSTGALYPGTCPGRKWGRRLR